jgi:hypothetical protein
VVYHLTSNFNDPENTRIKEITLKAVENINATLKKTGSDLQIVVLDKTVTDKEIGDLRVSSIVLVEDPIAFRCAHDAGDGGRHPTRAAVRGLVSAGRNLRFVALIAALGDGALLTHAPSSGAMPLSG